MADTDEAIREARRQGYEEGRKAERADIVEWLRGRLPSYGESFAFRINSGANVAAKKGVASNDSGPDAELACLERVASGTVKGDV